MKQEHRTPVDSSESSRSHPEPASSSGALGSADPAKPPAPAERAPTGVRPAPANQAVASAPRLDPAALRELLLEAGADDAACISIDHPALVEEAPHANEALPGTRTLVAFCVRMNAPAIRSPARSLANDEFHHAGEEVGAVGARAVRALRELGIESLDVQMGFPMEADRFPGRIWVISHKTVAEAAGLGVMGLHRNLIHPRLGNFILLGTLLVAADVEGPPPQRIESPCAGCKLCVAACPVGAIGSDGYFDFSACYTHNYREFMGGFTDWVETVADSRSALDYRERVSDSESVSMWQSLSYGANYKAAYCMAACPAGEDWIAGFAADRAAFKKRVLRPLQRKEEAVYVVPGTDAERFVRDRYPHKRPRLVGNSLRPVDVAGFLRGLPLVFQRRRSEGLDAVYHFRFEGEERREATVVIRDRRVEVRDGLVGEADLEVRADARTWVRFVRKEVGLLRAVLTRRLRWKGSARLLVAFGRCFP